MLDEADRLLDMGFSKDIEKIVDYLPREKQTLLFSATVPKSLRPIMEKTMRSGYELADCIGEGGEEEGEEAAKKVVQVSETRASEQDKGE